MFNLIDRPLTPEELRQDYIETIGLKATLEIEKETGCKIGECIKNKTEQNIERNT